MYVPHMHITYTSQKHIHSHVHLHTLHTFHIRSAPTARCALVESEMVAKIGGECVLTDAALEKLIVMVR